MYNDLRCRLWHRHQLITNLRPRSLSPSPLGILAQDGRLASHAFLHQTVICRVIEHVTGDHGCRGCSPWSGNAIGNGNVCQLCRGCIVGLVDEHAASATWSSGNWTGRLPVSFDLLPLFLLHVVLEGVISVDYGSRVESLAFHGRLKWRFRFRLIFEKIVNVEFC